jgi:hypothetical protein
VRRAAFSAGSAAGEQNNAQATRAESAQTVLRHLAVTTSSKFKARKCWRGLCVRWRRFDRGQPGSVGLINRGDRDRRNRYLVCRRNVAAP